MTTSEIYSFLLAVLAAGAFGVVGAFALMRKTVLAGDVMSHLALPGLGIAFLMKANPLAGAAVTLILGAILISQLQEKTGFSTDVSIGVIFAASVAIGALVTPREDIIDALFGGFGTINLASFVFGILLTGAILFAMLRLKDKLTIGLFSPELASSMGVHLSRVNLYYLIIFVLTILLGLQFLGAVLVGALVIIPAAIARQLANNLSAFLILSIIASVVSVAIGFGISIFWHLSLGPTIIVTASALFGISLLKRRA